MAVTQTGSISNFNLGGTNSGTVSSAITVPSDAELVVVGISGFATANYFSGGGMTFTKGGSDTAMTAVSGGDASTSYFQGALFYLVLPDTGSNKTLKWDWAETGTPTNAPLVSVSFWKGVDTASPVRDSDGVQAGGLPYTSGTLTALSGDRIVAWAFGYAYAEGTIASWSNLTLVSQVPFSASLADGAWASGSPSGDTAVAASTSTIIGDGGITAIVLKPTVLFGDSLGTLTGTGASVTDPSDATGSVLVAVDDLIYAVFAEETALTVTAVTDNLGNTYTATAAGNDVGTVTGRAFYSIVTVAGTLTTVSFDTTGSTNNWAAFAAAYRGPFGDIDANPANGTSDITSPLTCPATGTLAQADEVVLAWGVADQTNTWAATSPNLLAGQASTSTTATISVPTAGTGTATTDGSNPSVSLTTADMAAGDWIYIFGGHFYRAAVSIGPTTGVWEQLYSENAGASTIACGWWRKLWDGSESSVACYGSGTSGDASVYKALILRGAGDIDAVVVPATGSSTNPNAPAITTVAAGAAVLIAAQSAVSDANITAAANYTCTFTNGNAATNDMSTSVGYDLTPAANPENPAGWTAWATGNWRALIVSVAPAVTSKVKVALGYQLVSATTTVSPAFTVASNPTQCVLGTSSFGAPSGSDSITVDSAGLTLTGQSITTIDVCPITQANLSLAGQSIVSVDVCPITQANLSLSGSAITELDKISITPADLSLTGQTIDVPADAVPVVYMPSAVIGSDNPARIPHRELTWVSPALRAVIETITVDSADLTLAGQTITTADVCPITQANLTLAGQSIAVTETERISIAVADLTLAGQSVTVSETERIAITPADLTLAGQSVTVSETERVAITAADLTLAGQSITEDDAVGIIAANLTLTGSTVAVTETDRIGITAADLTLAGQSLTTVDVCPITAANLTLTGSDVAVSGADTIDIMPADLTLTGSSVGVVTTWEWVPRGGTLSGVSPLEFTEDDAAALHGVEATTTPLIDLLVLTVDYKPIGPGVRGIYLDAWGLTSGVYCYVTGTTVTPGVWGAGSVISATSEAIGGGYYRVVFKFELGESLTNVDIYLTVPVNDNFYLGSDDGSGIDFQNYSVTSDVIEAGALTLSGSDIVSVDVCPITQANLSLTASDITEVDVVGIAASNLVLVGQDIGVDFISDLMPCVVTDWGNPAPRLPAQRSWMYRPQAPSETISVTAGELTLSGSDITVSDLGAPEYMPCVVTDWGNPAPRLPAQRSWMYRPQAPSETISITAGELTLSGSDITLTDSGVTYVPCVVTDWGRPALPRLAVDPTWINQNIAIRYSDTIGITASPLTLSGSVVAVTDTGTDSIPVESVSLTLSGSDITETGIIGISSASLALSGSDVAVTDTNIIPIESASLTLSGSEITEVDTVSISSVALVLAGSEIVLTDTGISRQKDGDPDYWKLPWFQVEGGTFAERLLAETLLTLSEEVTESQAVKRKAREAAKKVQAYAKAAGPLLSGEELAKLDRLVRQLRASRRVESIQPRIEETQALLIAQMMQQDEDEAITALLL